jgi:hypothetical protein
MLEIRARIVELIGIGQHLADSEHFRYAAIGDHAVAGL